ncbi:LpxI family protein [Pseudothioclava arenosa]|uniref:Phosphatidate cytidylyltransferase n=1 Tax=Pseudothioclava arenosa TaxID=1795308 RepID=A0A2A4CMH8_9RHOB|nr:UDP-2,3-diacylglucosamine diphosphatase LpxI [Pseudothioclava arenosa]PCD75795.1 phosphatidate cytidylyltransferase [Pseudothioclava arenosa]
MTDRPDTALIAGMGALPALLAAARPNMLICEMEGFPASVPGAETLKFRVERLVPFLDHLVDGGVKQVVFAGAMRRPRLEPELFDPRTASLVPRLLGAMQAGDDETLRAVIELFEEWGLEVVGADQIAPDLVPGAGILTGAPSEADRHDAARAASIVAALGAVDVGQGAVVAQGLCIATESLPGTDEMLRFAAQHKSLRPDPEGARGVFYKAPKPGQDRRIDLPAIGPQTVENAAAAGLAGIVWEADGVLLLDRAATVSAAEHHGLFLWAREP